MGHMRRLLPLATAALLCLAGCGHTYAPASPAFSAEVTRDGSDGSYWLFLTLTEGPTVPGYTVSYLIDGFPSAHLMDGDGGELPSGFPLSFASSRTAMLRLPELAPGAHSVSLTVSLGSLSSSLACDFEVAGRLFEMDFSVNPSPTNSVTEVTAALPSGDRKAIYDVTFLIDGAPGTGISDSRGAMGPSFRPDFGQEALHTFSLPVLIPGGHILGITVTDGRDTVERTLEFVEPVRHPHLDLTVERDAQTGRYTLTAAENPYGVAVTLSSVLELTGECTYTGRDGAWNHPGREHTATKTVSGSYGPVTSVPSAGEALPIAEGSLLAATLEACTEEDCVWEEEWNPYLEEYHWRISYTARKPYTVTASSLSVTARCTPPFGVTARVRSTAQGTAVTWNGTAIGDTFNPF